LSNNIFQVNLLVHDKDNVFVLGSCSWRFCWPNDCTSWL